MHHLAGDRTGLERCVRADDIMAALLPAGASGWHLAVGQSRGRACGWASCVVGKRRVVDKSRPLSDASGAPTDVISIPASSARWAQRVLRPSVVITRFMSHAIALAGSVDLHRGGANRPSRKRLEPDISNADRTPRTKARCRTLLDSVAIGSYLSCGLAASGDQWFPSRASKPP